MQGFYWNILKLASQGSRVQNTHNGQIMQNRSICNNRSGRKRCNLFILEQSSDRSCHMTLALTDSKISQNSIFMALRRGMQKRSYFDIKTAHSSSHGSPYSIFRKV